MKKKFMKRFATVGLAVSLLLTGCSSGEEASTTGDKKDVSIENVPERFAAGEEVKIKVIRKIGGDDHTAQFLAGAKKEGEALGFTVDVFTANGDSAKFHDAISQAANQDYDGVIISHGDDSATVTAVQELKDKGVEVVTFDSVEELSSVEGVTLTSQDDEALATLALNQLIEDFNGEAKIAYLWVDGFAPMVRRNAVYEEKLASNPGLKELERFGVATSDTSVQTQNAVQAMLNKYPKGELDAIFATWDAFAIGAARAIEEAGRDEVKIYGIDVSNADLQLIQQAGSSWKYTAAVDPALIGAVDMRILAKKIAGEDTPQQFALDASLISQEEISKYSDAVNMENLSEVVDGWGESADFEEEWMKTLKEYYAKN